ncbi:MAG: hypothetical protein M3384_01840 [Acidobacteriota bacterium]|nr:hypothetical protein [Acidobacteriota bacterium]
MKRTYTFNTKFALVFWAIILTIGSVSVFGQKSLNSDTTWNGLAEEVRPFDFSSRYYYENGVEPGLIVNRRSGSDNLSVLDSTNDERFRGVRITGVFPAYSQDGDLIYWNLYGELFKSSFRSDRSGADAQAAAEYFPMYVFPSDFVRERQRQASVIDLKDSYFDKNPLGLSIQVEVKYTERINTDEGRKELEILARRNGASLDGTPIIKTVEEIQDLTRKGLVTQIIKGLDNPSVVPSYVIGKVIQKPDAGAIAPDAFLIPVQQQADGERFHADALFIERFNCFKDSTTCSR